LKRRSVRGRKWWELKGLTGEAKARRKARRATDNNDETCERELMMELRIKDKDKSQEVARWTPIGEKRGINSISIRRDDRTRRKQRNNTRGISRK